MTKNRVLRYWQYLQEAQSEVAHAANKAHNRRMKRGDYSYIWQADDWPHWRYDLASLASPLAATSQAQGLLLGRLADAGVALRDDTMLTALTQEAMKSSEIEGELLPAESVRSSIARHLGVDIGALAPTDQHIDGVVSMVLDATGNCTAPLDEARLMGWHAALFPTGYSGFGKIRVGQWRNDANGPMQVVSGAYGRQKVHFEAPPAQHLPAQMQQFLHWLNADTTEPALIKAALAHLWFVTLHPFDDGNGRIARAIGDLLLARADGSPQRFYSLSAQIQRERKHYHQILEHTQKGTMDVTAWLQWLLQALQRAIEQAHTTIDASLERARFWQHWRAQPLNPRQAKVLGKLLDGLDSHLTNRKWAALAKCSADTALRDINDLVKRGILQKINAGRSTRYVLSPLT